jgi:hypothetical protein
MKKILVAFFCFAFISSRAQVKPFPAGFIGNWKGALEWITPGKPAQLIPTQLKIQPADTAGQYTWTIIYGEEGKDYRPYLLKPVDTAAGHWVVDEIDGIVLDSYVHGNAIHGAFTLGESTLVDNYKVENGKLTVEFITFKLGDKKTTGKGTKDTPFVDSYRVTAYQSGVLNKVD